MPVLNLREHLVPESNRITPRTIFADAEANTASRWRRFNQGCWFGHRGDVHWKRHRNGQLWLVCQSCGTESRAY